jgi:hypothetical protein
MRYRHAVFGLLGVLLALPVAAQQKPTTSPPAAPATTSNSFATEAAAKAKCPTDTVVWVNTSSKIYHFAGTKDYGHTKAGSFMCEKDATGAGDRAAKSEKHP